MWRKNSLKNGMEQIRKGSLKNIFLIIAFTVLLLCAALNIEVLWNFVKRLVSFVSPVLAGLAIAYVLNVLMRGFENKVFGFMNRSRYRFVRNMLRPISLVLTLLVFLGIITVLIAVVWPDLEETVISLSGKLPAYFNDLKAWGIRTLRDFGIDPGWLEEFTVDWKMISNTVQSFFDLESTTAIIGGASSLVGSVAGSVMDVVFSFVIAIYFLAQKERICSFTRRLCSAFLPDEFCGRLFHVTEISNRVFSSFIRGQCTEAVIFGVLCYIGMLIFRFPYAGIISIVIGCTALIPIVGALIGEAFGVILILTVNPWQALLFLIFVLVLQQLEGSLIYPKVVGDSVGLPGILVFSAVIIGGNIGGLVYALISVPVCAVLYILLREAMEKRTAAKAAESAACEASAQADPPSPPEETPVHEERTASAENDSAEANPDEKPSVWDRVKRIIPKKK